MEFPRQGIIVGTANSRELLVDPTGDRRYWIVPIVKKKIDIQKLREERDHIWSAAVNAYLQGESWWLTDQEQILSNDNNQKFQVIDEWQGAIADYLEYRDKVSITEILEKVMSFALGDIDRRSQMRVANILTCLNWEKLGQQQHQGKRQVVWKKATPPLGIAEVLRCEASPLGRAETQLQQELSKPTIPTTPSSNSKIENQLLKTENYSEKLGSDLGQGIAEAKTTTVTEIEPDLTPDYSPAIPVDWLSYPYQSRDVYTLQNRANKVKDRVLGCGTNNELISLHADGKVSEVEINWIKANLLSDSELSQLAVIEGTKQGNLFDQEQEPEIIEWKEIKEEIDSNMPRLGWSEKKGKDYLIKRYGKSSRLNLTDAELIEFSNFLKKQS